MDAAEASAALPRLRPGTRIRLFWIEQGDRYAATGTLRSVGPAEATLAADGGEELTVPVSAVTCFYLRKPPRARPSLVGRLREALRMTARHEDVEGDEVSPVVVRDTEPAL
jgi:hypothetical protein